MVSPLWCGHLEIYQYHYENGVNYYTKIGSLTHDFQSLTSIFKIPVSSLNN